MGFWVFFTDDKLEYYDSDDCALYLSSNRIVEIVNNDKVIFEFLVSHRNQPMTRGQIQSEIYGWSNIGEGNNKNADRGPVDQAISKLRRNLDDYRWCIKTVSGYGYKYIGPKKVDKETADAVPNPRQVYDEKSTKHEVDSKIPVPSLNFDNARDLTYMRKVERAKRTMTELNDALKLMKEAETVEAFQKARFRIADAIEKCPSYAEIILEVYGDENEGTELLEKKWQKISDKLKRELVKLIKHYSSLIEKEIFEIETVDPDLAMVKLEFLEYLKDFHLTVAILEETLKREQERLRSTESQIQKEYLQRTIRKTEYRFDCSRERDREEDMVIDDMVDAYTHRDANDIT